jgi:hypothetical protein
MKKIALDGVLIGDSYANHTGSLLDVLAKDAKMYILIQLLVVIRY